METGGDIERAALNIKILQHNDITVHLKQKTVRKGKSNKKTKPHSQRCIYKYLNLNELMDELPLVSNIIKTG